MKKVFSVILMLFVVSMSIFFVACQSVEDIAGTYKFAELYTIKTGTIKVGDDLNGETLTEDSAVLVLNNDENLTATYTDLDYDSVIDGTWDRRENMITFTSNGLKTVEIQFQIRETKDLLLIINEGETLLLKKVDTEEDSD